MRYSLYTGIIIKKRPYRESGEIITLWTWEEGKVSLLAKGVRKPVSKLRALTVPLSWISLKAVSAKPWPIVTGGRIMRNYPCIGRSLQHVSVVFSLFEMILRATPDFQANHGISQLLREMLDILESQESIGLESLVAFRLRFFSALGYRLVLQQCVNCQTPIKNGISQENQSGHIRAYWSHIAMGAMCEDCARHFADAQLLDTQLHQFLSSHQSGRLNRSFSGDRKTKDDANRLLEEVFYTLTERNLKSTKFIKETGY